MANIILLFLCLFLGIGAQRLKAFPSNAPVAFNQFILHFSLPAMALYYLPQLKLDWNLLIPFSMPWIHFGLAYLFFNSLGKKYGWSKKLTGCLILTAGLGNTSFVGIPVIQALYGDEGLKTLIIVDLPGTFMILSTLGIVVANMYASGGKVPTRIIAKKVLSFPTIWAFIIGILINISDLHIPEIAEEVLLTLSKTITPLALVSVGMQLKIDKHNQHYKFLILGLSFQLLIIPALFFLVYRIMLGNISEAIEITIIESAMAPMITAAIIAASHGLKPRLSNMMIGIGIPVSFLTIGFWYWLLQYL